jgi:hypothetical protein
LVMCAKPSGVTCGMLNGKDRRCPNVAHSTVQGRINVSSQGGIKTTTGVEGRMGQTFDDVITLHPSAHK